MASFQAPPGHLCQTEVAILQRLLDAKLTIEAPDADLKAPQLTTAEGHKVVGTMAVVRAIAASSGSEQLAPPAHQAALDKWLEVAAEFEACAAPWVEPTAGHFDDEAREASKPGILSHLAALEDHLPSGGLLPAGAASNGGPTLADVAVACALAPLWANVLGADVRAQFPAVDAWLSATAASAPFADVTGGFKVCSAPSGWVEPAPPAGADKKKKKKKGGGGGGDAAAAAAAGASSGGGAPTDASPREDDPEKAAKKAAKLAEKEAKKAKLAAKQAAQEAAAKAKADGSDKKAKAKAEAEAKRMAEAEEVAALVAAARATPKGECKRLAPEMYKAYHPTLVEAAWYDWWEASGFFKPELPSDKPPFVIVIPPPNVTGALHIGHALTNAVQDTIVRWRRMSGYNVLWVPGTDHAGIATQTVVEKMLAKERHVTRHDLGREGFLAEVYKWVDQYGGRICGQLRRMGSSVDWGRQVFTMDAPRSAAVLEAFVRMYEAGAIYRDNRLVNWDCRLRTAVSDIEVDYIDIPGRTHINVPGWDKPVEFGALTSFAYPLEEGEGEIVVATTRPETMLGDTAVAVHPDDARYKHLHGKFVVHPVSGRRIPIITDAELVDMAFGTGAVKITPAHDPNDFAVGKRHGLEFINVLDDSGAINAAGGPFAGQHRFEARVSVVEFLKGKGLFRGVEDNAMRLGLSSRSKDVIEPVLKPQWWVACKSMADASVAAVRSGELEIIPKEFDAVWFRWLENIRDWCVSRQLWWGHRIPAYYVTLDGETHDQAGAPGAPSEDMGRWVVGRTEAEARAAAEAKYPGRAVTLTQDEDVLDTWFSSGLFPFSVMGWPEPTQDMAAFYPGALLETGHDILFFWVARMVMMGIQLTGQVPFKQVYLHAMVRDAHGRKMSKSLGNVIDPLHVIEGISLEGLHETLAAGNLDPKEVAKAKEGQKADFPDGIDECGTDALRFALVSYTTQARDINLDIKRVVAYRHWCNKLWNATKFALMYLPGDFKPVGAAALDAASLPAAARWVLSRLNGAVRGVVSAMQAYAFADASQRLYGWWQYDLCDVFIELMKPIMAADPEGNDAAAAAAKDGTCQALAVALDVGLRLLHPYMPFVTEELWQRLPKAGAQPPSIMVAEYPSPRDGWDAPDLERDFADAQAVVGALRKLRNDYGLTRQRPAAYVVVADARRAAALAALAPEAAALSTSGSVEVFGPGAGAPPAGCSVAIVDDAVTVHMLLKGVLDPQLELAKLEKKRADAAQRASALRAKTALPSYAERTPANVKAEDEAKLGKLDAEVAAAEQAMADMRALLDGGDA